MAASLLSFTLPKPNLITTIKAVSTAAPTTSTSTNTSIGVDTTSLEQKFGRKGIKFSETGGEVELTVRNGSSLKLQIADGHITSYKPKVYWKDDGFQELLYTVPSPTSSVSNPKSKGGIGLVLNNVVSNSQPNSIKGASSSSSSSTNLLTSDWTVKDVDSDTIDALQVELSCTSGSLDLTYVVSLYAVSIATAIIVKNNGRKPVSLTGAILSHFKFKKRSGTAINGLQGCSYCTHPPLSSPSFELLSPSEAMKSEDPTWFSFSWEPEKKTGEWATQDVPFTILKNKLSRVYAAPPSERSKQFHKTAPTKYETLDQGRELFYRVIRLGFEDIYVSSPGSFSDKYGKEDYFICTGPASMLVPVVVNPGEEWRGAQVIEHDNL